MTAPFQNRSNERTYYVGRASLHLCHSWLCQIALSLGPGHVQCAWYWSDHGRFNSASVHTCTWTQTHAYTHTHTYTHTCIHTWTHTHTKQSNNFTWTPAPTVMISSPMLQTWPTPPPSPRKGHVRQMTQTAQSPLPTPTWSSFRVSSNSSSPSVCRQEIGGYCCSCSCWTAGRW